MWDQIFFLEKACGGIVDNGTEASRWSQEGTLGVGGGLSEGGLSDVGSHEMREEGWVGEAWGAGLQEWVAGEPGGCETPLEAPGGHGPADRAN